MKFRVKLCLSHERTWTFENRWTAHGSMPHASCEVCLSVDYYYSSCSYVTVSTIDVEAYRLEEIWNRAFHEEKHEENKWKTKNEIKKKKKHDERKIACGKLILGATSSGTSFVCSIYSAFNEEEWLQFRLKHAMGWSQMKEIWLAISFFFSSLFYYYVRLPKWGYFTPHATEYEKYSSRITITINTLFSYTSIMQ